MMILLTVRENYSSPTTYKNLNIGNRFLPEGAKVNSFMPLCTVAPSSTNVSCITPDAGAGTGIEVYKNKLPK